MVAIIKIILQYKTQNKSDCKNTLYYYNVTNMSKGKIENRNSQPHKPSINRDHPEFLMKDKGLELQCFAK